MKKEKLNNISKVTSLIEEVSGQQTKVIGVPSELIHMVGNTQQAVFLSQLIYWSDKGSRTDGYIFKTKKEWWSETGLSEGQISAYTKLFVQQNFITTKLKKANGNPTIHYKVNIENVLFSMREFLILRFEENQQKELPNNDDSLTENTTDNTQDISIEREALSTKNKALFDDSSPEKSGDVSQEIPSSNAVESYQIPDYGEKELITTDFKPSLDSKFRAVIAFPEKHQEFATEKFINHCQSKRLKKTPKQWEKEWWNWMSNERPTPGNNLVNTEHNKITNEVCNLILGIHNESTDCVVTLFEILAEAEDSNVSKFSVEEALKILVIHGYFAELEKSEVEEWDVEKYYIDLKEYRDNDEWTQKVDAQLRKLNLRYGAT